MSRKEGWKTRLDDMREASEKIIKYCNELKSSDELATDTKTFDACIRNFQVLGDAAKKIPPAIQSEVSSIPWREIKGMRNVIVHEYFGTSSKIIWKTVKVDLPKLVETLTSLVKKIQSPQHSWKICPPGETYVRKAHVDSYIRKGFPVSEHLRRDHCRESPNSIKSILTAEEIQDIERLFFQNLKGPPSSDDLGYGRKGNAYDMQIRGWVKFWNDVFSPAVPLDGNIVKALIATESSFNDQANKGKRNAAKGLMQLLPQTIRYLKGERAELRDHIFEFDSNEVFNPSLNIALGVRWLFRKRETASARLNRQATWVEAVSEYKDYLRRKLKNPSVKQSGMISFLEKLELLEQK